MTVAKPLRNIHFVHGTLQSLGTDQIPNNIFRVATYHPSNINNKEISPHPAEIVHLVRNISPSQAVGDALEQGLHGAFQIGKAQLQKGCIVIADFKVADVLCGDIGENDGKHIDNDPELNQGDGCTRGTYMDLRSSQSCWFFNPVESNRCWIIS